VITKPRMGRARALNVAWENAKSDYIANIDADDLAEPYRLAKQVAFLKEHPEVGLLGTPLQEKTPGGQVRLQTIHIVARKFIAILRSQAQND